MRRMPFAVLLSGECQMECGRSVATVLAWVQVGDVAAACAGIPTGAAEDREVSFRAPGRGAQAVDRPIREVERVQLEARRAGERRVERKSAAVKWPTGVPSGGRAAPRTHSGGRPCPAACRAGASGACRWSAGRAAEASLAFGVAASAVPCYRAEPRAPRRARASPRPSTPRRDVLRVASSMPYLLVEMPCRPALRRAGGSTLDRYRRFNRVGFTGVHAHDSRARSSWAIPR